MNKSQFYRYIEKGELQGSSRYLEYWYIYSHLPELGIVLDLGSGRNMLPSAMKKKGLDVTITEITKRDVDFQNKMGVSAILVDSEKLPFLDDNFDFVTSASAIEHFTDGELIIKEAYRVLKQGGKFILTLPVGRNFIENRYTGTNHPQERILDEKTYRKWFGQFTVEEEIYFRGSNTPPTDYIPHKTWKDKVNNEPAEGFDNGVGVCTVLIKL